jgi:hypothetical protein
MDGRLATPKLITPALLLRGPARPQSSAAAEKYAALFSHLTSLLYRVFGFCVVLRAQPALA